MVRQYHLHIGVGSALLVLIRWAMREPRIVGRVTGTIPRFFIYNQFCLGVGKDKMNDNVFKTLVHVCFQPQRGLERGFVGKDSRFEWLETEKVGLMDILQDENRVKH